MTLSDNICYLLANENTLFKLDANECSSVTTFFAGKEFKPRRSSNLFFQYKLFEYFSFGVNKNLYYKITLNPRHSPASEFKKMATYTRRRLVLN